MTDALGLSVGAVNLVAVRPGQAPVVQRHATPTPTPSDRSEDLAVDALDALSRSVGYGEPVGIAVPAYWGAGPSEALRVAVRSRPGLNPGGTPALIIADAAAALSALRAGPGLPPDGVVALCDFGGSGTSITLVDAAAKDRPVAPTVRYQAFSGEQLDDAILNHLLSRLPDNGATGPAGTAAVGSLTRLRDDCRAAKERLSDQAATGIPVDLPGFSGDIQLSRAELEDIVAAPLSGAIDALEDALRRNGVPMASLAAVAMVGGCASIPLVGAQLSERLRVPLVSTAQPRCAAARGAALLAQQSADTPTSMTTAAWAATVAADGDQSATFRALAWSQDDSKAFEPVPYSGADYSFDTDTDADGGDTDYAAEPAPLAWYKRPVVLFALAAALALAATGGLAYTLSGEGKQTGNTAPGQPAGEQQPPPAPSTVTITAPNGSTSLSTIPPPPPSDASTESTSSTTTEPTTTTTTTTEPSTTTTTQPTTTAPSTSSTASQPTRTTQQQPSSSAAAPTTTAGPTTAAPTSSG